MSYQLPLVFAILMAAALYLLRRAWFTWSGHVQGCRSRCQCTVGSVGNDKTSEAFVRAIDLRVREKRP
jgi:hypothetical protein